MYDLYAQERAAAIQARDELFVTDEDGNVILDEHGNLQVRPELDTNKLQEFYHYRQLMMVAKIFVDETGNPVGEVFKFNSYSGLNNLIVYFKCKIQKLVRVYLLVTWF